MRKTFFGLLRSRRLAERGANENNAYPLREFYPLNKITNSAQSDTLIHLDYFHVYIHRAADGLVDKTPYSFKIGFNFSYQFRPSCWLIKHHIPSRFYSISHTIFVQLDEVHKWISAIDIQRTLLSRQTTSKATMNHSGVSIKTSSLIDPFRFAVVSLVCLISDSCFGARASTYECSLAELPVQKFD